MTGKRFRYYEHKGADYILDNPNESLDFIEMLGDCLEAEEVVNLLNALHEENQQLRFELDTHKHPLWSTREAERKVNELTNLLANETKKNAILLEEINSLRIENMRLKEINK